MVIIVIVRNRLEGYCSRRLLPTSTLSSQYVSVNIFTPWKSIIKGFMTRVLPANLIQSEMNIACCRCDCIITVNVAAPSPRLIVWSQPHWNLYLCDYRAAGALFGMTTFRSASSRSTGQCGYKLWVLFMYDRRPIPVRLSMRQLHVQYARLHVAGIIRSLRQSTKHNYTISSLSLDNAIIANVPRIAPVLHPIIGGIASGQSQLSVRRWPVVTREWSFEAGNKLVVKLKIKLS